MFFCTSKPSSVFLESERGDSLFFFANCCYIQYICMCMQIYNTVLSPVLLFECIWCQAWALIIGNCKWAHSWKRRILSAPGLSSPCSSSPRDGSHSFFPTPGYHSHCNALVLVLCVQPFLGEHFIADFWKSWPLQPFHPSSWCSLSHKCRGVWYRYTGWFLRWLLCWKVSCTCLWIRFRMS